MSRRESEYEEYEFEPRRNRGGKHVKPKAGNTGAARSAAPRSSAPRPAAERPGTAPPPRKKAKKRKKGGAGRVALIVVLALIVVAAVAGFLLFRHFYGLLNSRETRVAPSPTPGTAAVGTTETVPEFTEASTVTPEPLTEEELRELEEIQLRSSLQEDAEEILYNDNVYNLLLLGADGRSDELERSDAMILLSINKETKTIWLTSLMRDTQVTIPNWGTAHLNWATAIGGVDMLISTLESEKNFAIHIDNWALVDFADFVEIADMLGSITVDLTAAEINDMNVRIREVARIMRLEPAYMPEEDGTYELSNGQQILAYCRERHIGGDTGRSKRQHDALIQLWNNVKQMPLTEQYKLMEKIMSIVRTDLGAGKCASLLLSAPSFLNYDIQTQQCPVPGAFWKGRDNDGLSIYNADFRVNRNFLRATIYGEAMTAADLTSSWTGESILVMTPTA